MCRVTLFANLKFGFFPNIDTQPNCYCSLSFKFCHSMKDWGQISSTVYSASVYTLFTITLKPTTCIYNATSWWVQHLLFCCYEETTWVRQLIERRVYVAYSFRRIRIYVGWKVWQQASGMATEARCWEMTTQRKYSRQKERTYTENIMRIWNLKSVLLQWHTSFNNNVHPRHVETVVLTVDQLF